MDPKILTAVFVSLAAVATGMDMGAVNPNNVSDIELNSDQGIESVSTGMNILDQLLNRQRPEPDKQIRAEFVSEDLNKLAFRDSDFKVEGMKNYTGKSSISSDEEILFTGLKGKALMGENSSIKGNVEGFVTSGVNATTSFPVNIELDRPVRFNEVRRIELSASNATGKISSSDGEIERKNTGIHMDSFSGDIFYNPANRSFVFSGKVNKLKTGDLTIS